MVLVHACFSVCESGWMSSSISFNSEIWILSEKIIFSPKNHQKLPLKNGTPYTSLWSRRVYSADKLSYHFKISQEVQRCLKNTWVMLDSQICPQIMSLELLNRPCRSSKRCVTLSPELLFCLLLKYLRPETKTWYQHFYSTSHNTVIRFQNRMECWFLYNEGKTDFV